MGADGRRSTVGFHLMYCSSVQQSNSALPRPLEPKKVRATLQGLPLPGVVEDAAEVFRALANPTRVRVLHALAHEELCVGDLARVLGSSMSALSHQLALLRRLKLVRARDEGRQTFYSVSDTFVGDLVHDCLAHVEGRSGRLSLTHPHPHRRHR